MLRPGGLFFFSVPFQRDDVGDGERDEKGRWFSSLMPDEWVVQGQRAGFGLVATRQNEDGLGRVGVWWVSMLLSKESLT